jgi:phosphoadenosine phosphosulfate reductase
MAGTLNFLPIRTASRITSRVLVGVSGGKDSVVCLDLCARYFDDIRPFFLYVVPGLSFQEAVIDFYERKYGVKFLRLPHFILSYFLNAGIYRKEDPDVPEIGINDVYAWLRLNTGIHWIAAGERISDSLWRRGMIKSSGTCDPKRGRFYPVAHFSTKEVLAYIKHHRLKFSPETNVLGYSLQGLEGQDLFRIKQHYPQDFRKMCEWFPFLEAGAWAFERRVLAGEDELPTRTRAGFRLLATKIAPRAAPAPTNPQEVAP